jgi:hypothetical protein
MSSRPAWVILKKQQQKNTLCQHYQKKKKKSPRERKNFGFIEIKQILKVCLFSELWAQKKRRSTRQVT